MPSEAVTVELFSDDCVFSVDVNTVPRDINRFYLERATADVWCGEATVIPGEFDLGWVLRFKCLKLSDIKLGEDAFFGLPHDSTFRFVTHVIVVRVFNHEVFGIHTVFDIVSTGPAIHHFLAAARRVGTLADWRCTSDVLLVQSVNWVAREAALTVDGFYIFDCTVASTFFGAFEHQTDAEGCIATFNDAIFDDHVGRAVQADRVTGE